jgi:hypothetical protein
MRTLVLASIAIAALLGLLAREGRRDSVQGAAPQHVARGATPSLRIAAAERRRPAAGARGVEAPGPLPAAAVVPARVASAKPAADAADAARRVHPTSAYGVHGVHRFAPGSKGHAEAIASTLASGGVQALAAPVARLYFASFNRAPDYEGLNYYIDERNGGEPLAAIADEFAGSVEFDGRYGELDNAAFVDRIHLNIAGSAADAALRAQWIAQLDSGAMTRGELMVALSESTQFRSLTANPVFVTLAYAETLGRAPSPAELERWVAYLDRGHPRDEVIQELLGKRPPR